MAAAYAAASQAAMLALTPVDEDNNPITVAIGDVCVRTDTPGVNYVVTALPISTLGNWSVIAAAWPAAVDDLGAPLSSTDVSQLPAELLTGAYPAIMALELKLGINPQGGSQDVATRLAAINTALSGLGTASTLTAGAANGAATLDGTGKLTVGQLPALAINHVYTVGSQSAMLALAANPGDVAIRTDTTPPETFMLSAAPASTLGNWLQISIETGALTVANNLADVADAGTSRANLHVPVLTPAAAVATTNITLSGPQTIDGYAAIAGDLILCVGQTTSSQNGLWTVASGSWTRPTEYATGLSLKARTVAVVAGTVNAASQWVLLTDAAIVVDTTATSWRMLGSGTYESIAAAAAAYGPLSAVGGRARTNPGALTETFLERARSFTTWLQVNGVQGYVGEIGWPSETIRPGEGAAWNDLGARLFTHFDDHALPVTYFDATKPGVGDINRAYGASAITVPGTLGGTFDTKYSQSTVLESHLPAGVLRGLNLGVGGGANLRVSLASTTFYIGHAGTLGTDYAYPTLADYQYLVALGYKIFRIGLYLERLLTAPGSALVTGEVTAIQATVAAAVSAGGQVVLDCHNFGQIGGTDAVVHSIGADGYYSQGQFADFWTKMSTAFKGNAGVYGYGIMNEPWGSNSRGNYVAFVQAAVTAIRGNTDTTLIIVPTQDFDLANRPVAAYTDTGSNMRYEAHLYPEFYGVFASTLADLDLQNRAFTALATGRDAPRITGGNTIVEETLARVFGSGNFTPTSGAMQIAYFTAMSSTVRTKIYMKTRGTAASGLTYASVGLASVNSDDSGTILASSTSDNSMFSATFTNYTKTITANGLVPGQRYAIVLLLVGTTMPVLYGGGAFVDQDQTPRINGQVTGLSTLPASWTAGGLSNATGSVYATFT